MPGRHHRAPAFCSFTAVKLIRKKLSVYCASQHQSAIKQQSLPYALKLSLFQTILSSSPPTRLIALLMARSAEAAVRFAQYQIFNKLCIAYMRGKDPAFLRAKDIQHELAIPEPAFAQALRIFKDGDPLVVEVVDSNSETYLRLGEAGRYNCDDV